ncbi:hypothetical protein OE88DRAFT_1221798 [Heliocybe sulcata]|uniref:Uncharacterized protein n=1 Tax=Heliocybe sulcata TaxID=5364 RepID=A0A5C3MKA7_9AGAM|nr:hypothetical protein OE88DRAFT_1221798 [Heliocybe sulcata]
MISSANGIICASKLTLRHSRHLVNVSVCQNRALLYHPSTCGTAVQKRRASTAKALVWQGKHRIPKHDIPATARIRGHSALSLRTLKPARLDAEEFVNLTGRVSKTVHFSAAPEEPRLQIFYFRSSVHIQFPPDSQGFFYWHFKPDAPPVSGQLRFRTTTSSDPATFLSGHDLQLPNGRTWNISLLHIARRSKYSALRTHLLAERLVTAKVLDTATKISPSYQDKHSLPRSYIPATTAAGLRNAPALLLRTLNQARLNAEDFADIAGRLSRFVRFPLAPAERRFEMRYFQPGSQRIPFPPDTHGFLYWYLEPGAPPASGQVRFRTTTSSDPATFPSGRDLQLPDSRTWNISPLRSTRRSQHRGLRAHLLAERLVTAKMLDTMTNISPSYQDKHSLPKSNTPSTTAVGLRNTTALLLCTLNQTRLNAEDFADLNGRLWRYVRFPLAPAERGFQMRYLESGSERIPFPPDSHGFLYWSLVPVGGTWSCQTAGHGIYPSSALSAGHGILDFVHIFSPRGW